MAGMQHFFAVILCACLGYSLPVAARVVSLDYCADQYVLEFVSRDNIAAVSPDATRKFSYLRSRANGLPTVKPIAEDILLKRPDIVVRSYGGGAGISDFLQRFDIKVVEIGYAMSLQDIKHTILTTSAALGAAQQGEALVAGMNRQLKSIEALNTRTARPTALYMTPTGVTSGPNTLIHELLGKAGLRNYQSLSGWHSLPLERLIYESPDVSVLAFFDTPTDHASHWSAMAHPIAQRQQESTKAVPLEGAWTACGGWFVMEAIQALSRSGVESVYDR
ncbi:MAG: ABC transporter substrate-binding protein [Pseudomonadota bacterium]